MNFHKFIRRLRKERKWTQRDVALKIGMTRENYVNFENGKQDCKFDTALVLLKVLGVSYVPIDELKERSSDKRFTH